jgi:HSP20 family protein
MEVTTVTTSRGGICDMVVLTTRRPSAALQLRRHVDRMMHDALYHGALLGRGHLQSWTPAARWIPRIDVLERENQYVIRAEIPGLDPEKDVEISVQDGTLTLKGERRKEERTEGERYVRFESSYGSFQRSFPLPKGTDPEAISASHNHGILEIAIPRVAEPARKIPVTLTEAAPDALEAEDTRSETSETPETAADAPAEKHEA